MMRKHKMSRKKKNIRKFANDKKTEISGNLLNGEITGKYQ